MAAPVGTDAPQRQTMQQEVEEGQLPRIIERPPPIA